MKLILIAIVALLLFGGGGMLVSAWNQGKEISSAVRPQAELALLKAELAGCASEHPKRGYKACGEAALRARSSNPVLGRLLDQYQITGLSKTGYKILNADGTVVASRK